MSKMVRSRMDPGRIANVLRRIREKCSKQVREQMNEIATEPPRIAGPVPHPSRPRELPPPGAWDIHAHIFGPSDKFPYQPGRGYTPPEAPVTARILGATGRRSG